MPIGLIDLADAGSPEKLVTLILKHEPDLSIPVPVEDLCRQLEISEFREMTTAGFQGGLLTDAQRSFGVILLGEHRFDERRRYTVGHELGHYLMPSHVPAKAGNFLCSRADMLLQTAAEQDRRARMEVEANRFSSLLLIPPPHLRKALASLGGDPSLESIVTLAKQFKVSKEAMARTYVQFQGETLAIIVVRDGKILRIYKKKQAFPFIVPSMGDQVPAGSSFHKAATSNRAGQVQCLPDHWIDVERGRPAPELFEQVLLQHGGYAMILLHLIADDEDEAEEEREFEGRWNPGAFR